MGFYDINVQIDSAYNCLIEDKDKILSDITQFDWKLVPYCPIIEQRVSKLLGIDGAIQIPFLLNL